MYTGVVWLCMSNIFGGFSFVCACVRVCVRVCACARVCKCVILLCLGVILLCFVCVILFVCVRYTICLWVLYYLGVGVILLCVCVCVCVILFGRNITLFSIRSLVFLYIFCSMDCIHVQVII